MSPRACGGWSVGKLGRGEWARGGEVWRLPRQCQRGGEGRVRVRRGGGGGGRLGWEEKVREGEGRGEFGGVGSVLGRSLGDIDWERRISSH